MAFSFIGFEDSLRIHPTYFFINLQKEVYTSHGCSTEVSGILDSIQLV